MRREIFSVVARNDQKLEADTSNFQRNKVILRGKCTPYQRLQVGYATNFPRQLPYCERKKSVGCVYYSVFGGAPIIELPLS